MLQAMTDDEFEEISKKLEKEKNIKVDNMIVMEVKFIFLIYLY